MKKWMQKIFDQLDIDWKKTSPNDDSSPAQNFSEEKATLLYAIDVFARHLHDLEQYPARRTREAFDEFAKEIIQAEGEQLEKVLFRFRQYINTYRIEEYSYVQKTFDDFRGIIWDFVDQLSEDISMERESDKGMRESMAQLKDAVESNSIDTLKQHSRQFIDFYTEFQSKKETHRTRRVEQVKKNLDSMKKQLSEANSSLRQDHLTKAFNRKSFEEQAKNAINMNSLYDKSVTLLALDIDHFKKINDNYGHPMGDFILQECVKMLQEICTRDIDCVARVGGEEFAILLPDYQLEHAVKKAEAILQRIRAEVFVKENLKLQFTISIGIAEYKKGETIEQWMKRADQALYESKHGGRNRFTISGAEPIKSVA